MRPSGKLGIFAIVLLLPASAWSAQPEPTLAEEEESVKGLALDAAIDQFLACNYSLRIRFQEIPQARADELTASLRNAPAIFIAGNQFPYGRYSEQRPGTATYEVSPAANVDYSGKRRSQMRQTRLATRQSEARYQNVVREEIDRLYDAYVDFLESRANVRVARDNLASVTEIAANTRALIQQGNRAELETADLSVLQFKVRMTLEEAEKQLLDARRNLAALLALPLEQANCLEVRGSLHDRSPPPRRVEDLLVLALESRPDLTAQRLGVAYDRATVQVVRAERFDDAIVFYSPFEADNNRPQGKQVSTGWGGGAGTSLPILERNQGEIARARINVSQTQIELEGLERRITNEVQRARTEYEASRAAVRRYEQEELPAIRRIRDEKCRRFTAGEEELGSILSAQNDSHEELQGYVEALARHRRSMLKLNTVVGQRILP